MGNIVFVFAGGVKYCISKIVDCGLIRHEFATASIKEKPWKRKLPTGPLQANAPPRDRNEMNPINPMQPIKKILIPLVSMAILAASASGAVVATQSIAWSDGDTGSVTAAVVAFDIVNANSILIATIYYDNLPTAQSNISGVRFGNNGGIGSGDIAPTYTYSDSRTLSYLFINPSTASGLAFRLETAVSSGIGAILYEVSGASLLPADITVATGSDAISTTKANELIVAFGGRNGSLGVTVNASSIFTTEDQKVGGAGLVIRGGGSLSSASITAPAIVSNNITFNNATEGKIAFAFEQVPEPSTALLSCLGVFGLILHRRR